jgi:hypothetical protein
VKPPRGFGVSARQAIAIGYRTAAVEDERGANPPIRAVAFERGGDWQVSYLIRSPEVRVERSYGTAPDTIPGEVARVRIDGGTGRVLEVLHDRQLSTPLARGYSGAVAQKVNAPYVWIPLCLLFFLPFFDPRRPFRLLHFDLLVLLGFGVSLFFFNRAALVASVSITYPVLGYVFVRMLIAGLWPRARPGPLVPVVPVRWLALVAIALVGARIALNVVDSHVIDVGLAGVIGADHITHGQELYNGTFSGGIPIRGDVYGPFTYLAYVPFEAAFPWDGTWGSVPAAHAAAIAFDLLTALGLLALGRRLRAGAEGRALGVALAFAWLANPFTLYAMNANVNDSLVAALLVGALLVLTSAPARGAMIALAAAAKFGPAALGPLFATGTGERRLRSTVLFALAFAVVAAAVVLPFVPDGGLRELYDRTLGYEAARGSPFSVWGLAPSVHFLQPVVRAAAAGLALVVAFYPRSKSAVQVAALATCVLIAVQAGATHWFYFYVVWFLPLVLFALFAEVRSGDRTVSRSPSPAGRAAAS